jgi:hypothetical protein
MTEEIERGPWSRAAALLLTTFGGGGAGMLLGNVFARDSEMARALTAFMLPVALVLGLGLWLSAALFLALVRLLIGLVRRERPDPPDRPHGMFVPPGSALLLVVSVGCSLVGAGLVSLLLERATPLRVVGPYGLTGVVYGLVAWRLARLGYLRPPEEG